MLLHRGLWLAGGWLLVGLVLYLSLMPSPPEPLPFPHADKLEHGIAYAALALWFCQLHPRLQARMTVLALLVAMGVAVEFMQEWSGYRYFDIRDMLANSLGVAIGYGLVHTAAGRLFVWIESALRKN
ncbi:MAG TPA: VanZ family protein [Gallionella sp.]